MIRLIPLTAKIRPNTGKCAKFCQKIHQISPLRRCFCSSAAATPYKKMRDQSASELQRMIERRIRDKRLEAIVEAEKREKTDSSNETDNEDIIDSVFVRRYFKENVRLFESEYSDVIANLKAERSSSSSNRPTPDIVDADARRANTFASQRDTVVADDCRANTFASPRHIVVDYPYDRVTTIEHKSVPVTSSSPANRNEEGSSEKKAAARLAVTDRGFYVQQNTFTDDYVIGSAADLPQERQFSLIGENPQPKKIPETFRKRMGAQDAVEEIEFQLPYQSLDGKATYTESDYEKDWTVRYGVADPDVPPADKNCPACGAQFHCQNTSLPGFLPVEYFEECKTKNFVDALCRRCYLIKHHNFLLNVNVSKANYEKMLTRLRNVPEILIILIVDLLDFPCSIYKDLPRLVGAGKHVIVVGNKVDLIPPDSGDYLKHYTKCLRQSIHELGIDKQLKILSVSLISAKTGYGIEKLVSRIYKHWGNKGDIYLIGCTNSGKSTLFNLLLQSDLCKIRAADLVERATTSIWPGTTLNLLKFPVMNPNPFKMKQREDRLKMINRIAEDEDRHRMMLLKETGDSKFAVLQGYIGQTFPNPDVIKHMEKLENVRTNRHFAPNLEMKKAKISLDTCTEFKNGLWCYDTPGTVNSDQIINMLTLEELTKTIPGSLLTPRTVILHKNKSLLIGGLARVDFVGPQTTPNVLLTVFASEKLPIYVLNRLEVSKFYSKYVGTKVLEVPCGGDERLNDFPQLCHKDVTLSGQGADESCADVLLSSVGWVSVAGHRGHRIQLKAWTPRGLGIFVREPALLPNAVTQRGEKMTGKYEFEVLPLNS